MNANVKTAINIATIAGSAALVVSSLSKLVGVKKPQEAVMPAVSMLVGVAAFNYAIASMKVTVKKSSSED